MQSNELNQRVLRLLAQERALHGHGSAAEMDQRIGKSEGYLGRVLRGEIGLQTEMLFRVIEVLEIDLASFFAAVVGLRMQPERCLDRLARCLSEEADLPLIELPKAFGQQLKKVVEASPRHASGGDGEPDDTAWDAALNALDAARFIDPSSTGDDMARLLSEALGRALKEPQSVAERWILARTLAVASSIERVEGRARPAVRHLRAAFALVGGRRSGLYAELLQRACYQIGDHGDYEIALEMASQATDIYVCRGDLQGIGRSLIDRAVMMYKLGTPHETLALYRAGLRYLPASAWQNRFAALQGMGMSHLNLGQVDEADRCAELAKRAHSSQEGLNWWRLIWLQAEIAYQMEDLDRAAILYTQVREAFAAAGHVLDVALLSLQMARVLLAAGKMRQMQRLAASSMSLLRPLRRQPVVSAALHEFTRLALTGDLTVRWIDQASSRIEKGHPKRGASIRAKIEI